MLDNLEEKRRFAALMVALSDYYKSEISKGVMALYWEGLKQYDFVTIEKAAWAHTQSPDDNGRWMPKISDLTKMMQKDGGWLGVEEAWALMPKHESESAMLTDEIAQAIAVATPLIEQGDRVAARMAFKDAYTRLVERAKLEGRHPRYFPSYGTDKHGAVAMLAKAVQVGQIPLERALEWKPEAATEIVKMVGVRNHPLLAAPSESGKAAVKALLADLRAIQ